MLWPRTWQPQRGLIASNTSSLTAVNTSLTLGLASKANQSALDALQVQVDGKSTPASVDLKLANHPTTAAMNSSIASANNATLATVAATYALKLVADQLALDVAARQTAGDVAQAVATALLPTRAPATSRPRALRTTPADASQLIATALLPFVQQTAVDAALALRDARLDGHDAEILALQGLGPLPRGFADLSRPSMPGYGGPRCSLLPDQFLHGGRRIRSLVPRAPVSLLPILGNGSALELDMDCWSKSESDWRYVLTATFNGLGTQVTALDGRVAALEASPLPADIFCTSLTASSFVETPELQGTPIVLRAIDNTPLLGPRCWSRTPPASS
eukprot:s352_g20.t1